MQWTDEPNGGFSTASREQLFRPVVSRGSFAYRKVNVAAQRHDPDSLLNWFERMIRARKECPELGLGPWEIVETRNHHVFGLRAGEKETGLVAVHNLSDEPQTVKLDIEGPTGKVADVFGDHDYADDDVAAFDLEPYGYRWLRLDT
jgi:maltose alpha-D-glucosyltransferase/alpha-amylase